MFDLTKKDKKIARIAIDKGLDVEYKLGLEKAEKMIAEWRNGKLNNKDAYLKLYRVVDKHDDQIARRYNSLRGSRYLITVANILYDGYITEEDVKDFSDAAKEQMNRWIQFWKSNK